MTNLPLITSFQNPKIKAAVKLRNKRDREKTQTFLVEGYRELASAAKCFVPIQVLFYSPSHFLGSNEYQLIDTLRKKGVIAYEVSPDVFTKLSYRDRGDGLLAIAKQTHRTLSDLKKQLSLSKPIFLLLIEAIEKPGNLGSILRSADAAGVDGLILCDRCTDIHNPNVVRASIGTLFTVPIIETTTEEAFTFLRQQNISIIASTPSGNNFFTEVSLTKSLAIAVGTEQLGLSEKWLTGADICVKIPMLGACDSLNVATATTLLLYEVVRQRQ